MPVSCVLLSQEEAGEGSAGQTGDKLESRGIHCTFALALCRRGRGGAGVKELWSWLRQEEFHRKVG